MEGEIWMCVCLEESGVGGYLRGYMGGSCIRYSVKFCLVFAIRQIFCLFGISFSKYSSLAKFTCKLQKLIDKNIIFWFICQEISEMRQDITGESDCMVQKKFRNIVNENCFIPYSVTPFN